MWGCSNPHGKHRYEYLEINEEDGISPVSDQNMFNSFHLCC